MIFTVDTFFPGNYSIIQKKYEIIGNKKDIFIYNNTNFSV